MNRYSRLLELSDFNEEKLELLKKKNVLLIGVGGVGQNIAVQLVTNGVTNLTIVDFDEVEISNLNRQYLISEYDLGRRKVNVVRDALRVRNKEANIKVVNLKVDETNIEPLLDNMDVVIDAVDNWPSKLVIAKATKKKKVLSLHVGVDGYKGQYCLFKDKSLLDIVDDKIISSPKDGVMGPMVSLISSMASLYLIQYFLGEDIPTDTLYYCDQKTRHLGEMKI